MLIKSGSKCERKSQVDDINVYPTPVRVGRTLSRVFWYERWKNKATITYKLFLISHHGKVISEDFFLRFKAGNQCPVWSVLSNIIYPIIQVNIEEHRSH